MELAAFERNRRVRLCFRATRPHSRARAPAERALRDSRLVVKDGLRPERDFVGCSLWCLLWVVSVGGDGAIAGVRLSLSLSLSAREEAEKRRFVLLFEE